MRKLLSMEKEKVTSLEIETSTGVLSYDNSAGDLLNGEGCGFDLLYKDIDKLIFLLQEAKKEFGDERPS